jgi:hypothetical protein
LIAIYLTKKIKEIKNKNIYNIHEIIITLYTIKSR